MVELQRNLPKFHEAGIELVGISYDPTETLSRVARKLSIRFPLLSDTGSKTIDAYGLRNAMARGRSAGIPHPTTVLVDENGVIRAKLSHPGSRNRHSSDEIIAAAQRAR